MAEAPRRLGRYEIEGELGRGAMGVVHAARDPRVGRRVALKTLALPAGTSSADAEELKARFLREAQAAGRLNHPGVVAVLDADEDSETGTAYIVMELVEGEELRSLLAGGMPPARVADIVSEVADVLDHAHERGVVHRDVKPANVMVTTEGRAKLADFGVARLADSTATRTGQMLGSPAYMAPEQIRGRGATPATDLFSLAVVAYEALTGVRPFRGEDLISTTHAVLHEEPEPPSRIATRLPAGVDAVLRQALAKKPEDRFPTGSDFAAALRHALAESEVETVLTQGARGALTLRTARGRRLGLVAAVALVGVATALLVASRRPSDGDVEPARAREARPPESPASSTPRPADIAAVPAAAERALQVDVFTMRLGTLVVRCDGEEIGRTELERGEGQGLRLDRGKRHFVVQHEIPGDAGRLTLVYAVRGGRTLEESVPLEPGVEGPLRALVDVGALGRKMELQVRREGP